MKKQKNQKSQKRKKPVEKKKEQRSLQKGAGLKSIGFENIDTLMQKGAKALQQGDLVASEKFYLKVLEMNPGNAEASNMMGIIALNVNRPDVAAQFFASAAENGRKIPDYAHNLSLALLQVGDVVGTENAARSALEIQPNYAGALNTLGLTFKLRSMWEDARVAFEKALDSMPSFGEAWINQCGTLQELDRLDEALAAGRNAIRFAPNIPESHYNCAGVLHDLKQYDEAISMFRKAITLNPEYAEAYINLSRVYINSGDYDEAEKLARKAIELAPDNYHGHVNLGLALCHKGELRQGVEAYYRARDLAPDANEPHTNLGFALLALEEFSTGWDEFEYASPAGSRIPYVSSPTPIWEGQSLKGKTIHIYGEQAIGDHIMYGTMIQDIVSDAGKVIYEVEPRLVPLFKRSFPEIDIRELQIPPDMSGLDPDEDYYISVGSLGRYLRRSVDDFKPMGKFLEPDPGLLQQYRESYSRLGDGPVIGISWRSASENFMDKKNIALDLWKPILTTPGCNFVSLQYGEVKEDIDRIKAELGVDIHIDHSVSALNSLEQCAAQTAAVDLVISISNATIHFAAGCGVETWMFLGRPTMWHWFTEREDTLWYQSVRAFRLKEGQDWPVVIDRAAENLRKYLAEKNKSKE